MPKLHKIFWENQPIKPRVVILDYINDDEELSLQDVEHIVNTAVQQGGSAIILKESDIPRDLIPLQPIEFHVDDEFDSLLAQFPVVAVFKAPDSTGLSTVSKEEICRTYIKHVHDFTV